MSYEKIYQDWEDAIRHARLMAENITLEIGKIHEAISKRPRNLMRLPRRKYMERAIGRLLGELAVLGDVYVSPLQDLTKEKA